MAIPVLKLNLAPPPTLWRSQHLRLGWAILALGATTLVGTLGITWWAYHQAEVMGQQTVGLSRQLQDTRVKQASLTQKLQSIDVKKEAPRLQLAERILLERANPWSRVMAELERTLVQNVRLKSIQRNRGTQGKVLVKLRGEAMQRDAEAAFLEGLHQNIYFANLLLEREGERQGGGLEFEATLEVRPDTPPYEHLPLYGPSRETVVVSAPPPATPRPAAPRPLPVASATPPPSPVSRPPSRPISRVEPAERDSAPPRPEGPIPRSGRMESVLGARRPLPARPRPEQPREVKP